MEGGRAVRWSVVASLGVLAVLVGSAAPFVGFVLGIVALDVAAWWFGADSRDLDERAWEMSHGGPATTIGA